MDLEYAYQTCDSCSWCWKLCLLVFCLKRGIETNIRTQRWYYRWAKSLNEKKPHKVNEANTVSQASDCECCCSRTLLPAHWGGKCQRLEIGLWVTWWSDKLATLARVCREENPFYSGTLSQMVKKYKSVLSTPCSAASEVLLSIKTTDSFGSKAALTLWAERWEEQQTNCPLCQRRGSNFYGSGIEH